MQLTRRFFLTALSRLLFSFNYPDYCAFLETVGYQVVYGIIFYWLLEAAFYRKLPPKPQINLTDDSSRFDELCEFYINQA